MKKRALAASAALLVAIGSAPVQAEMDTDVVAGALVLLGLALFLLGRGQSRRAGKRMGGGFEGIRRL